jgi:hypothetical protein
LSEMILYYGILAVGLVLVLISSILFNACVSIISVRKKVLTYHKMMKELYLLDHLTKLKMSFHNMKQLMKTI